MRPLPYCFFADIVCSIASQKRIPQLKWIWSHSWMRPQLKHPSHMEISFLLCLWNHLQWKCFILFRNIYSTLKSLFVFKIMKSSQLWKSFNLKKFSSKISLAMAHSAATCWLLIVSWFFIIPNNSNILFCQNCPVSALQKMMICLKTFPFLNG